MLFQFYKVWEKQVSNPTIIIPKGSLNHPPIPTFGKYNDLLTFFNLLSVFLPKFVPNLQGWRWGRWCP